MQPMQPQPKAPLIIGGEAEEVAEEEEEVQVEEAKIDGEGGLVGDKLVAGILRIIGADGAVPRDQVGASVCAAIAATATAATATTLLPPNPSPLLGHSLVAACRKFDA